VREKARKEFKELLKQNKKLTPTSTWLKVKKTIEDEPRYKQPELSSKDHQEIFKQYIEELTRQEQSKREREEDVKRMRNKIERERETIKSKQRHDEVMSDLHSLLAEKIRSPSITWREARRKLDKDPRWACGLTNDIKEAAFHQHIKTLVENRQRDFKALLIETDIEYNESWESVKAKIKDNPRYEKVSSTDREHIFERYMRERLRKGKQEFDSLLRSVQQINANTPTSGPEFQKMCDLLRGDRRWTRLERLGEQREAMVIEYIKGECAERLKGDEKTEM